MQIPLCEEPISHTLSIVEAHPILEEPHVDLFILPVPLFSSNELQFYEQEAKGNSFLFVEKSSSAGIKVKKQVSIPIIPVCKSDSFHTLAQDSNAVIQLLKHKTKQMRETIVVTMLPALSSSHSCDIHAIHTIVVHLFRQLCLNAFQWTIPTDKVLCFVENSLKNINTVLSLQSISFLNIYIGLHG